MTSVSAFKTLSSTCLSLLIFLVLPALVGLLLRRVALWLPIFGAAADHHILHKQLLTTKLALKILYLLLLRFSLPTHSLYHTCSQKCTLFCPAGTSKA